MKLDKVFGNKVLIEPRDVAETTASGIIMPTAKGQKQQVGTVIATGRGYINNDGSITPLEVKTGMLVAFNKFAGTPIVIQNKEYLIMTEADLLVSFNEN